MKDINNQTEVHSVRIRNGVWAKAKARAKRDNVSVSRVTGVLIEGYALGKLNPRFEVNYGEDAPTPDDKG